MHYWGAFNFNLEELKCVSFDELQYLLIFFLSCASHYVSAVKKTLGLPDFQKKTDLKFVP